MEKEYIVDITTGEVIFLPKYIKNILISYNILGYDQQGFYYFHRSQIDEIIEIIKYETLFVD